MEKALPIDEQVTGKLAENIVGLGRTLRRAGVPVDSSRIAMAQQAALLVGVEDRDLLCAAFESVLVAREQDRVILRELFEAMFREPDEAQDLLASLPAGALVTVEPPARPRVAEVLARPTSLTSASPEKPQLDYALTASAREVLRHADFNSLGAAEYREVERLAREVALPVPTTASRRTRPSGRGDRVHWLRALRQASHTGGELLLLPRRVRREEPLPLLVLVDISGSMQRYARMLLAFLHAALRRNPGRCDVFAFGTQLTDLTPAFSLADTDEMLAAADAAIADFGGGTRLGESLAALRLRHVRRMVGGRTVVLVVSDGLDTGEPEMLDRELCWLRLHSRRLLWLNPLLRFGGWQPLAQGAAVLHRHAHGIMAVHSLKKLQDFAASLAALMKT